MDLNEQALWAGHTPALNRLSAILERGPALSATSERNLNKIADSLKATNVILLTLGRFGLPSQNVDAFFEELRGSLFNLDPSLSDNIDHLKNS